MIISCKNIIWTSREANSASGGESTSEWHATGVSIDTRTLEPGDIFFALDGTRDGHDFVDEAFSKGAAVAVISRRSRVKNEKKPLLVVHNVFDALNDLAKKARTRTRAKIIGVTGSAGKTSTKNILAFCLQKFGKVHKAEKSYNNHLGVPLTLARLPKDTNFAVIEIGMSSKGEILPLTNLARPHISIITTIGEAHLQNFANLNEIAKEKSDICVGLLPNSACIISRDIINYKFLVDVVKNSGTRPISFGFDKRSDYRIIEINGSPKLTCARVGLPSKEELYLKVGAIGDHHALNALGAIAVMETLGLDPVQAVMGLERWTPGTGRGDFFKVNCNSERLNGEFFIIDDSYNANPKSMLAALQVLELACPADNEELEEKRVRRIAVLGDMLELGENELELHISLIKSPHFNNIDLIHCIGMRMHSLYEQVPLEKKGKWFENVEKSFDFMKSSVRVGDIIMLKGSKAMRLEKLRDELSSLGLN
mgnify:CR=1 FL=1